VHKLNAKTIILESKLYDNTPVRSSVWSYAKNHSNRSSTCCAMLTHS